MVAIRYTRHFRPLGEIEVPEPPQEGGGPPERDALLEAPGPSNTGPRIAITGPTLSGSEAIAAAIANDNVLSGRRITGMVFNSDAHADLTFEDCEIGQLGTGILRAVNGWFIATRPEDPERRVKFDHCKIMGGSSATTIGYNLTFEFCDISGGVDIAKPFGNVEYYGNYMHGVWVESGNEHCDVVQLQAGDDIVVHWNSLIGIVHPESTLAPGGMASGVSQLGGPLGNLTNVYFHDNWVNGGHYSLRGGVDWVGKAGQHAGVKYDLYAEFLRNKHGRDFSFGPQTHMGSYDDGRAISLYDETNVWQDNGLPVIGG